MSYIKYGPCEKCKQNFRWSIGHPTGWNEWAWKSEQMPQSQQWWFSFGQLCPNCAPPLEIPEGEESGINIMMTS